MKHKQLTSINAPHLLIIALLLLCLVSVGSAAALRGQLLRPGPNGVRYPASGVSVTVYSPTLGRSPAFRTGPDGMYYIQTPPGQYYLEIWINPNPGAQPLVYQVQVGDPYTDIPPIVLPQ